MKAPIRLLWMTLGLAMLLALPAQASEPPAGRCPSQTSAIQAAPSAPAPQWMGGLVDCDSCATHNPNPAAQCNQYCRSMGYFADRCEADADTCQLMFCYCLYD